MFFLFRARKSYFFQIFVLGTFLFLGSIDTIYAQTLTDTDGDLILDIDDLDDDNDGILDVTEDCGSINTSSYTATSNGVNKNKLYWFNWTNPVFQDGLQDGDSQIFTLTDGTSVTARFSNVSGPGATTMSAVDMDFFFLTNASKLYDTTDNFESLHTSIPRSDNSYKYTLTFTATKAGIPVPLNIVYMDPESSKPGTENHTIKTNGGPWKELEITGAVTSTGLGTNEYFLTNSANTIPGGGAQIIYSKNATVLDLDVYTVTPVKSNQASAFGLLFPCDTDLDGIENSLDLDSDGDGCPDALEGGAAFTAADLVTSSLAGGNSGPYYIGTSNTQMILNLGNTVGTTATDLGVPIIAGTGQTINYSLTPGIPTVITLEPNNQSVLFGNNTTFTVGTTGGTATILYQWQISIDSGITWTDLTNSSPYSNVNTAALAITAVNEVLSGNQYRAKVTQSTYVCTDLYSDAAILCVIAKPVINVTAATCSDAATNILSVYNGTLNYTSTPTGLIVGAGGIITGGTNGASYTITATNTSNCPSTSDSFTYNGEAQVATPAIPTLGTTSHPTCTVATGSFAITNYSASNTYAIIPSLGTTISGTGIVTAPTGTYSLTATANGCTSGVSNNVIINTQPAKPAIPTLGTAIQPTCTVATGSFAITNYSASNTYAITPLLGTAISGTGVITAPTGTYSLTATANGCTSGVSSDVIINTQPATPAIPILGTATQPTCTVATGSFAITNYNTSNTYAITPFLGTTISATGVVTAPAGTYSLTTTGNGCTSGVSSDVFINTQPATPAIPTLGTAIQPACTVATGSFSITNYSTSNTYAITPSLGTTISATGVVTAPTGTYSLTATGNGCTSTSSVNITINAQPPLPTVSPINTSGPTSFCSGSNVTLTAPTAAGGQIYYYQWHRDAIAISGATNSDYTALLPGSYTVTITTGLGCLATSSAITVILNPLPPATILSGALLPLSCNGTVTLNANTGVGYTYKWYRNGVLIPSENASSYSTTVTGNYTVEVTNGNGCPSLSAETQVTNSPSSTTNGTLSACQGSMIVLTADPGTLPSPMYQWYSGSVPGTLLSGETNTSYSATATGDYYVEITSGAVVANSCPISITINTNPNPTIIASGSTSVCPGVTVPLSTGAATAYQWYLDGIVINGATSQNYSATQAGNYTVKVTNASGCDGTSLATTVFILTTPAVPVLNTVVQPICDVATGSFTISNYNVIYTYTITPTGTTLNTTTGVITAPVGTYTVSAAANGCTSGVSNPIVINTQPATPVIPTLSTATQPTCTVSTGSFAITNYSASNTYAINPSLGTTISGAGIVTAPVGTYTVTASANGCTSGASNPIVINAQPATPTIPTLATATQPTCADANGSFTITNYSTSNTYVITPSLGTIISGTGIVTAPAGNYTVTALANGCPSGASNPIVINAQPTTPVIPTLATATQPTCTVSTGSFAITNYSASNTYAINPSLGTTISGAGIVTAPVGTYTVTASANGCTSGVSNSVIINTQPATPTIPTLATATQPTCAVANGTFTITNYSTSNTYVINPSLGTIISGTGIVTAPAGNYTVTAFANGCPSGASNPIVINTQPTTPVIPTLSTATQPTCTLATGSFSITNYSSSNTYAITPSLGTTISGTGIATAPRGTYTVTASANGCTSGVSNSVIVSTQPATPTVPILGIRTQPTCNVTTGSFAITNYSPSNTYAINPSLGTTISGTGVVTAPEGNYSVTAFANGCTSGVSNLILINKQPTTPPVPTLGTPTQPTCTLATGSFAITNYNPSNTYAISPSVGTTISGTGIVTAPEGNYTVTASANGCTSIRSVNIMINAQPPAPTLAPINVSGPTTFCFGSNVILTAPIAPIGQTYFYQWYKDAIAISGATNFDYIASLTGSYTVKVSTAFGCNDTSTPTIVTANQFPNIKIEDKILVCDEDPFTRTLDVPILDGTSPNDYTYIWSKNGSALAGETNHTLDINSDGIYTVQVKPLTTTCSVTRTITVSYSEKARIESVIINDMQDNNSVSVLVTGISIYEYSLDEPGRNFQDSNFFTNVTWGPHIIYVNDKNGCDQLKIPINVISIPKFFTPNNDGYNDTWMPKGINANYNAKANIFIFNRYGKLLKQLIPSSDIGWNGTYNGYEVPSDDYWYTIKLEDNREAKGHFTLKR